MDKKFEAKNETAQDLLRNYRQKLRFRAWHRGTREMDLLLGNFADQFVPQFDQSELEQFEKLLNCNDPDLYNWFTGQQIAPPEEQSSVLQKFLNFEFVKK